MSHAPSHGSALFPTRTDNNAKRRDNAAALVIVNLASGANQRYLEESNERGIFSFNQPRKKLALARALLSNIISHTAIKLHRSILRATAILSFLLFGLFTKPMSPPAHAAWGSKSSTSDVVLVDTSPTTAKSSSTIGRKFVKLVVTGGAVAAGAATSKNIRGFNNNKKKNDGDENSDGDGSGELTTSLEDRVVPKDKPSPIPLSSEWIEKELAENQKNKEGLNDAQSGTTSKSTPKPNKQSSSSSSSSPPSQKKNDNNPILVKNLDSKIEMLRAREALAKATAEKERLENLSKAEEVRKQEQADVDARIAAEAAKVKAMQAERQKKEELEREKQLSELEWGKKEQWRLERIKKQKEEEQEREKEDSVASEVEGSTNVGEVNKDQVLLKLEIQNSATAKPTTSATDKQPTDIVQARQQPKSNEEEQELQEKYGSMDLEERAFNILVDLGMVDLHSDPDGEGEDAFM